MELEPSETEAPAFLHQLGIQQDEWNVGSGFERLPSLLYVSSQQPLHNFSLHKAVAFSTASLGVTNIMQ